MIVTFKPSHEKRYTFDVDDSLTGVLKIEYEWNKPIGIEFHIKKGQINRNLKLEKQEDGVVMVDMFWGTTWLPEDSK